MITFNFPVAFTANDVLSLVAASEHPISAIGVAVRLAEAHSEQRCSGGRPVEWALNSGVDTRLVRRFLEALTAEGRVVAVDAETARQISGASWEDVGPFYVAIR